MPEPQFSATETAAIEAATVFSRNVIAPNAREWGTGAGDAA